MSSSAAFEVKGWCPGALRPMQSGDGLIVRIRPQSATFNTKELVLLADAARRFGNGHIDLTRRANLQIRGVREPLLPQLHGVIASLGLLDDSPDGEAVRNVMINPLSGIDPVEVLDVRSVGRELARLLASETVVWALPSKFGFIVDGGGVLSLMKQRADIRLMAVARGSEAVFAFGLETKNGVEWLGEISPDGAAATAIEASVAFIKVASREKRQRMRDVSDPGLAFIRSAMRSRLGMLRENPSQANTSVNRGIGLIELDADRFAVGIATPFGRLETDQLRKLSEAMSTHGVAEIRLSPWRALYAAVPSRQSGQSILDAAARDGLITDPRDPVLQIEACPGAPACPSTKLDTRGDGRRLAELLSRFRFGGTVHISGCAKGCAKSGRTDLVLIGSERHYGVVRDGTVQDLPARHVSFAEIAADPGTIFDMAEAPRYD